MNKMTTPCYPVSFVGTGPGDPDLLTVKAKRLIEEADVILYDCLPATNVLKEAAPNTEICYINKHPEPGEKKIDILNEIQRLYREGKKVVRLI